MTGSVSTEVECPPLKIPRLHEACDGSSKSSNKERVVLKCRDLFDDEYVRQYLRFYYQSEKSEGFTVDWEQFDYIFPIKSLDNPPEFLSSTKSSADIILEETLLAIERHNQDNGTKLVFVEHIQANYKYDCGLMTWLTFWAMDMNSPTPESKIYQVKMWHLGKRYGILIFRLKPTDQEIASVDVEPPSPMLHDDDYGEEAVVFSQAGPADDPGVPFAFRRTGTVPKFSPAIIRVTGADLCRHSVRVP